MTEQQHGVTQLCVCSEEMCFCSEVKDVPIEDAARALNGGLAAFTCDDCAAGRHVWYPDGPHE